MNLNPSQKIYSKKRFHVIYLRAVKDILDFWTPAMQEEIARHCYPWRHGATDFKNYLFASERRYAIAYSSLYQNGGFNSLCDIGGFFGVFALTLTRMGHMVAMTEALRYYSQSFSPLFDFLRDSGIKIIDYDPFEAAPTFTDMFDVISVMAVLEHYPHSLRGFMRNALLMLKPDGKIYIEVPNIAYWPKRRALLIGKSPLTPIDDIYHSSVPYIGHHHEFTFQELRNLASLTRLKILKENYYNYSFQGTLFKRLISRPLLCMMSLIPSMRECIAILANR